MAVVEDGWGNLFLADGASRVVTFYPALASINAANFLSQNVLAPGMIAAMFSLGNYNQFGGAGASASVLPLPKTLNGLQVLFNGAPVPLFYAGPNQINFQVPMAAPQSGTVEVQVLEPATGRLLGDGTVEMQISVPGLFTQTGDGIGTASALNQDNTVNSQNNPAKQGTVIQLYGTGQGFVPGAPPDGTAPSGPVPDSGHTNGHHGDRICTERQHTVLRACAGPGGRVADQRADPGFRNHIAEQSDTGGGDSEQCPERRCRRRTLCPDLCEAVSHPPCIVWRLTEMALPVRSSTSTITE